MTKSDPERNANGSSTKDPGLTYLDNTVEKWFASRAYRRGITVLVVVMGAYLLWGLFRDLTAKTEEQNLGISVREPLGTGLALHRRAWDWKKFFATATVLLVGISGFGANAAFTACPAGEPVTCGVGIGIAVLAAALALCTGGLSKRTTVDGRVSDRLTHFTELSDHIRPDLHPLLRQAGGTWKFLNDYEGGYVAAKEDAEVVTVFAISTSKVSKRKQGTGYGDDNSGDAGAISFNKGNDYRAEYYDKSSATINSLGTQMMEAVEGTNANGYHTFGEACVVPVDSQGNPVFAGVLWFNGAGSANDLGTCDYQAQQQIGNFASDK